MSGFTPIDPPGTTAREKAEFPQIMGATLAFAGVVWLLSQYDRKAAGILAATLLGGVAVYRDIPAHLTEFVDAVTGRK